VIIFLRIKTNFPGPIATLKSGKAIPAGSPEFEVLQCPVPAFLKISQVTYFPM
jgi:hypothetical protein